MAPSTSPRTRLLAAALLTLGVTAALGVLRSYADPNPFGGQSGYRTIQAADGGVAPVQGIVQFTGDAVSSVTDDPAHRRTVVHLSGSAPQSRTLTVPAPLDCDGSHSCDLSSNRTIEISASPTFTDVTLSGNLDFTADAPYHYIEAATSATPGNPGVPLIVLPGGGAAGNDSVAGGVGGEGIFAAGAGGDGTATQACGAGGPLIITSGSGGTANGGGECASGSVAIDVGLPSASGTYGTCTVCQSSSLSVFGGPVGTTIVGSTFSTTQVNGSTIMLTISAAIGASLDAPADGETALMVRRNVGGSFSLQRVSMGAADSGGGGFKVLRVPN